MKRRWMTVAIFLLAVLQFPKGDVEACGPDFAPDVFVNTTAPDDHEAFGGGHLGIIQPGFDSSDYAVAFRYLNEGKLDDHEHRAYSPPVTPDKYDEAWWAKATPAE